ncbi:S24/S26 family peptidase [Cohnella lubricantis]
MYPYILPGDECRFIPLQRPLAIGEIGLVVSSEGLLYSHRLHTVEYKGGEDWFQFRGDGSPHYDVPVTGAHIIGVLAELKRRGKTIEERAAGRRLWSRLVVRIPRALKLFAYLSRRISSGGRSGFTEGSGA